MGESPIENIRRFLALGPIHLKVHRPPSPPHWRTGQKPLEMDNSFGAQIRRMRVALYMFQADLAKAIGVSAVTMSKWERNINRPSRRMRKKLRDYFEQRLVQSPKSDVAYRERH